MNFKAIILAAGKGTRMKSKYPKVVHKVCGKEMVNHIIDVSKKSGVKDIVTILGHESEVVKNILPEDTMIAMQTEQLGTGHAVKMAKEYINDEDTIVILCGDTPLIKEDTLKRLFDYHIENKYTATVLTTVVENPTGYGRVIRDENGDVLKIVEQKDGTPKELETKEINSGIYCFKGEMLRQSLDLLDNNNAQGEYYLTDTIKILRDKGFKVGAYNGSTIEELMGVNSRLELSKAETLMRKRINEFHLINGVTIIDTASTYIEADAEIGSDTIIYPGVMIHGNTKIGNECIIGMNCSITNSYLGVISVYIAGERKRTCFIGNGPGSRIGMSFLCRRPTDNVCFRHQPSIFVQPKVLCIQTYLYITACQIIRSVSLHPLAAVYRFTDHILAAFQIRKQLA